MSERRLVIHAGFHKSGTTALQEAFDAQRSQLKKYGVLYPNIGRKAHHRVAWALTQRPWGWNKKGGEVTPRKHWEDLAKLVNKSDAETVLISSEFFSELNGDAIRTIFSEIKNRQVQVVFTVRPLVKLLSSSYQQYLKYGITADYTSWLHSVLDAPGESKINPTFWQRHFHGKVVGRWADVLGANNVTVIVVDESKPEFLFDSINEYLSLPKGFLKAQETGSNRSLTMEEISLLIELNKRFPEEREWDEYVVFIRDGYIRRLTDLVKPSKDSGKLPTPKWAIEKGNEIGARNKNELIATGVKIIGDIESLDTAQVLEGEPTYPSEISIAVVAEAMIGFNKNLVKKFPLEWVQSNIFKRYKRKAIIELRKLRRKTS